MTIEEIKRNKPDGATHYYSDWSIALYYVYYPFGFGGILSYINGCWVSVFVDDRNLKPL